MHWWTCRGQGVVGLKLHLPLAKQTSRYALKKQHVRSAATGLYYLFFGRGSEANQWRRNTDGRSLYQRFWSKLPSPRFTVGLLDPRGNDWICVIVDRLSNGPQYISYLSILDAESLTTLFIHDVCNHYSVPESIFSARGMSLVWDFLESLWERLGINSNPSIAYHLDPKNRWPNTELWDYRERFRGESESDERERVSKNER